MGGKSSKPSKADQTKIEELERQQKMLMKQNADLAKRFAEQEEENQRKHQENVEEMAKMILLMALQAGAHETVIKKESREIEIDGVTYELMEFVNRGGFGEIHKGKIKGKGTIVAIKVMDYTPALDQELKNEIEFLRLMKKIPIQNHPVIEYYGSKLTKEGIFIAMELAACDLATFWISKINEGDAQELGIIGMIIILYVLRALTFLEKLNIIHGDIKPQNLVIVPNEKSFSIKLIDFGTVEKMNTRVAQMTVDITKGFTLYFVSPEFLKRNSKNLICRHLHKKSDAWAAGVMFYLLFCGGIPWDDQQDYENFCNDPHAKDPVVPDIGGYKAIIELLLKKNPEQRSSAKATLLQLQAHPVFGKLVEALRPNFGPVDDVCNMRVPNDVRQGLLRLARPGHVASDDSSGSTSGARMSCRYGRNCTRNDTDHQQKFAHPGDSDYRAPQAGAEGGKPACRYGADCFRKDPDHLEKYSHPTKCRYGADCYNNDPDHRKQYAHSMKDTSRTIRSEKPRCRFNEGCTKRSDREHMKNFLHD
ncbi:unnamed protein product [Adineta ricciae]|uniref:Protein kinase domain-containing protein n=1 Tax=Adineta ricciae TaxID=249248 RepID=A0A814MYR8_ADIRI|nr:unnamed protein product [Adineta ricciae]